MLEVSEPVYDFTKEKLFSNSVDKNSVKGMLIALATPEFPWKPDKFTRIYNDSDLDEHKPNDVAFFTGTQEIIRYKWKILNNLLQKSCDCCGERIIYIPWPSKKYPSLCEECTKDMIKKYSNVFGIPKVKERLEENPWWLSL